MKATHVFEEHLYYGELENREWAIGSEAMRARGIIIVLVKSN